MVNTHDRIVKDYLPIFAQKLIQEGIIARSDRKPFEFVHMDEMPSFQIRPDRVLYLHDGRIVLVEVANPRDPKRFMGEIVYPRILIQKDEIYSAFFFILKGRNDLQMKRSMVQSWTLADIIQLNRPCFLAISWSDVETAYLNLRDFLKNPLFFPKK